mgnify:CR=1 FL=1
MAMIKCPECGKEISDKAESCPQCGCPLRSGCTDVEPIKKKSAKLGVALVGIIIVFVLVGTFVILKLKNNKVEVASNIKNEQEEVDRIIGKWTPYEVSLDGKTMYKTELFSASGNDVSLDLEVTESSFALIHDGKKMTGKWELYDEDSGTNTYMLYAGTETLIASMSSDNTDLLVVMMSINDSDNMYFAYKREK